MSLQPRIDSRAFRQIGYLEVQDGGQDEEGQQNRVWRKLVDLRVDVHSVSGSELIAAAAQQAGATHTIETPWQEVLREFQRVVQMRFRLAYRIFDIKTCDNVDEMNRLCRMMAVEGLKR